MSLKESPPPRDRPPTQLSWQQWLEFHSLPKPLAVTSAVTSLRSSKAMGSCRDPWPGLPLLQVLVLCLILPDLGRPGIWVPPPYPQLWHFDPVGSALPLESRGDHSNCWLVKCLGLRDKRCQTCVKCYGWHMLENGTENHQQTAGDTEEAACQLLSTKGYSKKGLLPAAGHTLGQPEWRWGARHRTGILCSLTWTPHRTAAPQPEDWLSLQVPRAPVASERFLLQTGHCSW